jgi:hypothetical protein
MAARVRCLGKGTHTRRRPLDLLLSTYLRRASDGEAAKCGDATNERAGVREIVPRIRRPWNG